MTVAQLKRRRLALKLSQSELGRLVAAIDGGSAASWQVRISNFERGEIEPFPGTLDPVEKALAKCEAEAVKMAKKGRRK